MLKQVNIDYIKKQFPDETSADFIIKQCELFCDNIRDVINKEPENKTATALLLDLCLMKLQQKIDDTPDVDENKQMLTKVYDILHIVSTNEFLGD